MTSMISSNKYLKKRKMKTQSREAIKPTRIGSTLPKMEKMGSIRRKLHNDRVKMTEVKMKTTLPSKNQEKTRR